VIDPPDRDDLVWLDFDPQAGHEQGRRRPALVLTPRDYNKRTGLMIVCPVTSKRKGYPFEVPIDSGDLKGVALADQIKSMDWVARDARPIGRHAAAADTVARIAAALILPSR